MQGVMQTVTPCMDLRLLLSTFTHNSPPTEVGFFWSKFPGTYTGSGLTYTGSGLNRF